MLPLEICHGMWYTEIHSGLFRNTLYGVIEMDIRAKIVNKVKSDPDIAAKFQKDPYKDR